MNRLGRRVDALEKKRGTNLRIVIRWDDDEPVPKAQDNEQLIVFNWGGRRTKPEEGDSSD